MGEMRVMDRTGDTKLIWDPANEDEVAAARRMFKDLTGKAHLAFAVKKAGDKGDQIREFDPTAAKIILTPPMRGG